MVAYHELSAKTTGLQRNLAFNQGTRKKIWDWEAGWKIVRTSGKILGAPLVLIPAVYKL